MSERDEAGQTLPSATRPESPDRGDTLGPVPTVPDGRYALPDGVLDPELGRGGMGRVMRLHDPALAREVAVKELLPAHRGDALMERLFFREAQVLARLEHPGVVPVYEVGRRRDGTLYYAMRRIRGRSLHEVLSACGGLSDRLALLGHCLDVVQTVGFAHSRGVVHRDLKAENVMVSGFGETLVIDWGLAVVDGEAPDGGISAGTPTAMAPEQAAGVAVDARSDVFSLGVLLYQVLAGRLPFAGGSPSEVMAAVQDTEPPPVRELEPDLPPALVAVVERALRKHPGARYHDAGAMAEALEAALAERARPARWPFAAVALLAAALVGLTAWVGTLRGDLDAAATRGARDLEAAGRARDEARGEAALAALRGGDAAAALAASAGLDTALGRGVAALAAAAGPATRAWAVRTGAGCAALAVSGELVACATLNQVLLVGLADGAPRGALETGPRGWQQGLALLGPGRLAAAGDDRTLRVFELPSGRLVAQRTLDDAVSALGEDGAGHVLAGLQGGAVVDEAGRVLQRHPRAVGALAAAPALLASSSAVQTLVSTRGEPAALDRRAGALAVAGGGLLLGVERTVAWLEPGGRPRAWGSHRADVTALAALGDGRVASADAAGELRWWSAEGALQGLTAAGAAPVQALAAGGELVLLAAGRALEAWRLPAPPAPAWDDRPTAALALEPPLAGFADGRVRPAGAAAGALELRHEGAVRALAVVPGEARPQALRLLSGGDDGRVLAQRWSGEVEVLAGPQAVRVLAVAVAPDGRRAAWTTSGGVLVLHSLEFGREVARLQGPAAAALAFSPDGRLLAAGRTDHRLWLLDAATGAVRGLSEAYDAEVSAVAWLGPGAVVAGRADGALSEHLVAEGRPGRRWTGPARRLGSLAVDAAHGRLAAGAADGQVWVWELDRPAPLARLPADAGEVRAVGFAGEALRFLGGDRQVHAVARP